MAPDDVGDQVLADRLVALCGNNQVALYPTASVREVIGGFSLCRMILCSDGGQMHLAAGLEKDTVVFFGETEPADWRPWSGNTHILKPATGESSDISVDEAWKAISTML